jgi:hypothetical protein
VRRLLILVLFGLVLAGAAAVTGQAKGQAKLLEQDLTAARAQLARAGGFESGKLKQRLDLLDQLGLAHGLPGDGGCAGKDQAEQHQDEQTTHEAPSDNLDRR